jgi:hypothetical protein
MMPRPAHFESDNDSLQADVMRFMAIIAFCLIAILALVRETQPAIPAPAPKLSVDKPVIARTAVPVPVVKPMVREKPEPRPAARPRWRQPLAPAKTESPRRPVPSEKPTREKSPVALETVAEQTPEAAQKPATPAPGESADKGLSLRFASDGDFLRLIARGDISVYAYNGPDVLGLSGAYEFLSARAPGQVYELLPQTIPTLIFESLVRARSQQDDSAAFTWAIALPRKIETQIEDYVASVEQGQLVIDRYGDVHHVAQR